MRRQTRLAAAFLMSLGAAGLAHSQEMTPEKSQARREALQQAAEARATHALIQAAEAAERTPAPQGPPPERFDLEFAGGTVADYAAAIRAAHPDANIVVAPEIADIELQPVSLKQVTTAAAISLVQREIGTVESGLTWLQVQDIKNLGAPEPVFSVTGRFQAAQSAHTAVISLADVISRTAPAGIRVEDILSAIEAATAMTAPPPKIRFHAETKLLLLHGSKNQVEALHSTITALLETADATADARTRE